MQIAAKGFLFGKIKTLSNPTLKAFICKKNVIRKLADSQLLIHEEIPALRFNGSYYYFLSKNNGTAQI